MLSEDKLVGGTSLIVGTLQLLLTYAVITNLLPGLLEIYASMNGASPSLLPIKLLQGVLTLFGILNWYFGIKLLSTKNAGKYFQPAAVMLAISLLSLGIIFAISVYQLVAPIYNLTTTF